MTQFANERQGEFVEELVADRFDLEHRPDVDWFDCANPRTGAKWEVKSAHREIKNGAGGRFRLWEDQHRSLTTADGQGTAWYAFVVLDDDGNVVDVERKHATTVTEIIQARGGWNDAGHSKRDGRQHKLPIEEVVGP